jgi:hypothetical protein
MREQSGVPYKFPEPRPIELEASKQRAGHYAGIHPEDRPYQTDPRSQRRFTKRGPDDASVTEEEADSASYENRLPRSARRYAQPAPPQTDIRVTHHRVRARATTHTQEPTTQHPAARPTTRRGHPLLSVGVGMLLMLLLGIGGNIALSWWQGYQNDLHYGRPRTTQVDARVGHDDTGTPSHFIAVNLAGHILIVEFPGGNATNAKVSVGPILAPGHELDPVTVEFRDVNGDGKPDMIVSVSDVREVFINDNGSFRPMRPGENVNL